LSALDVSIPVEHKLIEASSIAGGIAMESRDYDLVVLGAAREPFLSQVMFGEIPEKVARYSPASVLVVKRYEGTVRSWLKRALG
jgi:nucleotide-binding universal stress UspA family protein